MSLLSLLKILIMDHMLSMICEVEYLIALKINPWLQSPVSAKDQKTAHIRTKI